jgi:hypothetical protein
LVLTLFDVILSKHIAHVLANILSHLPVFLFLRVPLEQRGRLLVVFESVIIY